MKRFSLKFSHWSRQYMRSNQTGGSNMTILPFILPFSLVYKCEAYFCNSVINPVPFSCKSLYYQLYLFIKKALFVSGNQRNIEISNKKFNKYILYILIYYTIIVFKNCLTNFLRKICKQSYDGFNYFAYFVEMSE